MHLKTRLGNFTFTDHAIAQAKSRLISLDKILRTINKGRQTEGGSPNTMKISLNDVYVIVDRQFNIVTIAYKKGSVNYNLYR